RGKNFFPSRLERLACAFREEREWEFFFSNRRNGAGPCLRWGNESGFGDLREVDLFLHALRDSIREEASGRDGDESFLMSLGKMHGRNLRELRQWRHEVF
ncbi:hypothetical protein N9282_00455, partial [bacterium]|nr:hypothetical protein [bacterium]